MEDWFIGGICKKSLPCANYRSQSVVLGQLGDKILHITNNLGRSLVASSKWSEDWGLFLNPSKSEHLQKVWTQKFGCKMCLRCNDLRRMTCDLSTLMTNATWK